MKKIGIITLNGEHNYGNRLQNYALQKIVSELGFKPETMVVTARKKSIKKLAKRCAGFLPPITKRAAYWRMLSEKEHVFKPFSSASIRTVRASKPNMKKLEPKYYKFITGSDQVWNPKFTGADGTNFLDFTSPEKRISYAASFGVSKIPEEKKSFYEKNLRDIASVSVREQAGVGIVKELTGKTPKLVADPTMLPKKNSWDELTQEYESCKNDDYIVVYALHPLDQAIEQEVVNVAKKLDAKIYRIMGDYYNNTHEIPDPAEFVARIKHAKAVFTDSFHASVFSIIMHTPFVAFERTDAKMESRLNTLLSKFELQQALYDGKSTLSEIIESESFDHTDKLIAAERQKSLQYLRKALDTA